MWVVKIGGSLDDDAILSAWCQVLGQYGAGKVVIVPGGGGFADQVRHAQSSWKFNDYIAHRMALRSMDQYGLMLSGLTNIKDQKERPLIPASSIKEIRSALDQIKTPVWLPSQMLDKDTSIPQNWNMTSDSLSAWLAERLEAEQLILIKILEPVTEYGNSHYLDDEMIVDPLFKFYTQHKAFKTRILRADQLATMQALLTVENLL